MEILRFVGSWTDKGVTFSEGQEWDVYDSYKGIYQEGNDFTQEWVLYYRFIYPKDGILYTVPEWLVVIIQDHTSNNRTATTQAEKWDKKVTRDQIEQPDGKQDYVEAAKEFMGINIAAKTRQDQADYAGMYPLSVYLQKRSYD